ncbi:predicted protein [Thalassiosira pseudonana CCMP1335]|uniref:DUF6824 domain-containing protein n=1 Tax=Thalassiosira pseudonana TaxID=35128 RepID=B8C4Y5_THAPS|nr:predicted protein [Thalassiosira pseudonana CCMP1335]EED91415.1 predicted protein [Thalassiosira pseudonana CCMP1335]
MCSNFDRRLANNPRFYLYTESINKHQPIQSPIEPTQPSTTQHIILQHHYEMDPSYPTTNITTPNHHDILCGRGGGTNAHPGNINFRRLVAEHKLRYLAASKSDKPGVAREVVQEWRSLDPPGRFLAKMDDKDMGGGGGGGEKQTLWYDVGDKKAREKASQCLRERNGAANEAVQALVKTVTASGEACPTDYDTLMKKANQVKAKNDLTIQAQNELLAMNGMGRGVMNGAMVGGGGQQPYGLTEEMIAAANRGGFGGTNSGGNGNNSNNNNNNNNMQYCQETFEPISMQQYDDYSGHNQQQQQQYCGPVLSGSGGNYDNQMEDDMIEAEIKRMLAQKKQQMMAAQSQQQRGGGGGGMMNNNNNNFGGPSPYMGEDSVMREYEQLMQKQRQRNMMEAQQQGSGGMNSMNVMSNNMSMPPPNSRSMNNWNMGPDNMSSNAGNQGFNDNILCGPAMGNNTSGGYDHPQSPNNDAARNYLNRLRNLRKDPQAPEQTTSGGGNIMGRGGGNNGNMMNNNMGGMMNNNVGGMGMGGNGGGGGGGQGGFTIEEYQASLQEFLSNDGEASFGVPSRKNSNNNARQESNLTDTTQHANNLSNPYDGRGNLGCYQVPTSLGNKKGIKPSGGGRASMQSVDTFARATFQSVDSNVAGRRASFQSVDDMDLRPSFRSVDTMDLMSIGNSINEIIDDDVLRNPGMREKYARRLSQSSRYGRSNQQQPASLNDFANFPGASVEVKTMQHGQGGGGGPKKIKKIDPRLLAGAGTRHSVQTKDKDGPSGRPSTAKGTRGSMASVFSEFDDSRMSFGNMSIMSELTDFGDLLPSLGADGDNGDSFRDM